MTRPTAPPTVRARAALAQLIRANAAFARSYGRYHFTGGTAVVTGAASGIGAALARALAQRGSHLVLLDRDAEGLARVAEDIGTTCPVRIATYVVDLADGAAAERIGETLAATHPDTTLLVNNAGVALAGNFDQVSADQFDAVLAVNLHAVVTLTRALLPALTAHPGSHLVNLSSVFGLLAPAGQTAYCTSKFAVRGFTESLRGELAPAGVGVTCVHPGGVRTGIARNAAIGVGLDPAVARAGLTSFEKALTLDPADAAATILRAVERRRPRVLVGRDAVVLDALARLLPVAHLRLLSTATRLATRRTARR
jgi:short-subunit dehydrogenase